MDNNTPVEHIKQSDHEFVWHPFTQMKDWIAEDPIVITEGSGSFLKDGSGRWFLDAVSSIWVNIHGHRRREIDDAICSQLNRIAHTTLLGLTNEPAAILAEKLIKQTDTSFARLSPRLSKVFYSDNGSTAVEIALKMAFQYWRHKGKESKTRFVSLNNSYHGDTLGAVSVGGINIFHDIFSPLLFKTFRAASPNCYHCELGMTKETCCMKCLCEMEDILRNHSAEVAAVIVEPIVQAAGGIIIWPEGYLSGLRMLCTKYDVLLIADEVATGFGRTGKMFACEHEGVVPDIMCLSKGITNGYMPLAVTLATDEIFQAFLGEFSELKTFFHGHSYTGNPLACSAAIASLNIFQADRTLHNLPSKSDIIYSKLKEISELSHVGDVRLKGLIGAVELVKEKETKKPYSWEERIGWQVAYSLRQAGILLRPLGNVLVIMPPLSTAGSDLVHLMDSIKRSIISVTGQG